MATQWNKGHNWKRRELKHLLEAVENASDYDDMCEIMGQMWPIDATLPKDDGAHVYVKKGVKLCQQQEWRDYLDDMYWEKYG